MTNVYINNHDKSTKKTPELIHELSWMAGFKVNFKKPVIVPYTKFTWKD